MPAAPLLFLAALSAATGAWCADVGVLGPTYPIAEPHLLRHIEARLAEKERSGEIRRILQLARDRAERALVSPPPIAMVRTTTAPRSFWLDPSITLTANISDATGQVLFPAGTRVNPLDVVGMSRQLLFIDGRDRRQLAHAQRLMQARPGGIKPVLVGGSYLALMKAWRVPVYYDQEGLLVRRLKIRQVPALVYQEGARLRIDEQGLP